MANVRTIDSSDFEREVLRAETPVLVDFYADWCGPCRALAPVVDALAAEAGDRYRVVKVNVDESRDLAARYEIRSIPTLMIFSGGEMVFHHVGLASKKILASALSVAGALAAK